MQSDTVCAIERLMFPERVRALADKGLQLMTRRDTLVQDLKGIRQEAEALEARHTLLLKVGELFRALMDKLVTDQLKVLESVVTEGLRTIFFDQDLTFEADLATRYNKVAIDFQLRQGDGPLAIRGNPMEAFGGGPVCVASVLLRVLTLLRLKRYPLLFLDETLSAVSDEYIDVSVLFLKHLAAKTGMPVLLVTHKQGFLEHADNAYRGVEVITEDGARHLVLKQLRTSTTKSVV